MWIPWNMAIKHQFWVHLSSLMHLNCPMKDSHYILKKPRKYGDRYFIKMTHLKKVWLKATEHVMDWQKRNKPWLSGYLIFTWPWKHQRKKLSSFLSEIGRAWCWTLFLRNLCCTQDLFWSPSTKSKYSKGLYFTNIVIFCWFFFKVNFQQI